MPAETGERELSGNQTPFELAMQVIPENHWRATDTSERSRHARAMIYDYPELAAIYGVRRAHDNEIVACSEEDMTQLDAEIARALDEESHTPVVYVAPYPEASGTTTMDDPKVFTNNDEWLRVIAAGNWPVPAYYPHRIEANKRISMPGSYVHRSHDSTDFHMFYMMLAPSELQGEITKAAQLGVAQRAAAWNDRQAPKGLELGDSSNDDVLVSPGYVIDYSMYDAIAIIDQMTDEECFPKLLQQLVRMSSPQERQAYIERYTPETPAPGQAGFDESLYLLAENAGTMIALRNFNVRHNEKRNMTDTERFEAGQAYLRGIVRVADKLTGQYQADIL